MEAPASYEALEAFRRDLDARYGAELNTRLADIALRMVGDPSLGREYNELIRRLLER